MLRLVCNTLYFTNNVRVRDYLEKDGPRLALGVTHWNAECFCKKSDAEKVALKNGDDAEVLQILQVRGTDGLILKGKVNGISNLSPSLDVVKVMVVGGLPQVQEFGEVEL